MKVKIVFMGAMFTARELTESKWRRPYFAGSAAGFSTYTGRTHCAFHLGVGLGRLGAARATAGGKTILLKLVQGNALGASQEGD
jgi:hypothetical protein